MRRFTNKEIEVLTGVKASTLRLWEQRYDFFKKLRHQGRQRMYSDADLKKLLNISFLYHNGWKFIEIMTLSDREINEEVERIAITNTNYPTFILHLLQAVIDFNEAAFHAVLNKLSGKIDFERLIVDVCYPCLQRVSLLFDSNVATPAQEHFSVYIIQNKIINETEEFSVNQKGEPELVLFCPENADHELQLLFINYLLRKNRWRVLYLGSNAAFDDVKEAAQVTGVCYLYVHFLNEYSGVNIDDYFATLHKTFADKIIVASGKSIEQSQRRFVRLHLLKRDEEIYKFIEKRS